MQLQSTTATFQLIVRPLHKTPRRTFSALIDSYLRVVASDHLSLIDLAWAQILGARYVLLSGRTAGASLDISLPDRSVPATRTPS